MVFDMSELTQTIKIPVTTSIQFWNVIPSRVESSVKNCRYVFMIEPLSNPYPVSPSNMRTTPTVSAVMMRSVIAEPTPELLTSGCSRPLRGSRYQNLQCLRQPRPHHKLWATYRSLLLERAPFYPLPASTERKFFSDVRKGRLNFYDQT